MIARYGRMLNWVLDRQGATLLVAIATFVLTVVLYIVIPKGFFPVQDTGAIQGISEAPQTISFAAMAERQQALARVMLQDPAVESLSSFIGVDGTNATLNSGRLLINLKPLANGTPAHRRSSAACRPKLADLEGITLYMQPVQDLTIEDRVSRTQYQFTVEDTDADELSVCGTTARRASASMPQYLPTSRATVQDGGLQAYVDIDRATASRFGITPAIIDNALYNAFGQRLVSTIFTQTNQYRVVLEVKPEFQLGPAALENIYVPANVPSATAPAVGSTPGLAQVPSPRRPRARCRAAAHPERSSAAVVDRARHERPRRWPSITSGSSRRPRSPSTSRPAHRWATRSR